MHPWMIEQVARENRRDLLARAARPQARPAWTWRKLATYIHMITTDRRAAHAGTAPVLAPLTGGVTDSAAAAPSAELAPEASRAAAGSAGQATAA
jgi:hypothetical protein